MVISNRMIRHHPRGNHKRPVSHHPGPPSETPSKVREQLGDPEQAPFQHKVRKSVGGCLE